MAARISFICRFEIAAGMYNYGDFMRDVSQSESSSVRIFGLVLRNSRAVR